MADDEQEFCPHCSAPIPDDDQLWGEPGDAIQRRTCMKCALQLMRRPGKPWKGIRG